MSESILRIFILLSTLLFLSNCSSNSTGPEDNNSLPAVTSLALGNLNEIFLATTEGLYQSSDNGSTWNQINKYSSGLVAVSPSGNIFSTRRYADGRYSFEEILWRSTDGGTTFQLTGWKLTNEVFGLAWLVFNNQNDIFGWVRFSGLYRSTTQGDSWNRISISGGYVGLDLKPLIAPDNIFVGLQDGVYRSVDNGDNWIKVFGLNDITGDTSYSHNTLTFNSQGKIFVGINSEHFLNDSVETGMIYYSNNNGSDWIKASSLNSNIRYLVINPVDKIFVITDMNLVFSSVNDGTDWDMVSVIPLDNSVQEFTISANNKLFIRTWDNKDNEVYRSQNDGVTWQQIWPH